MLKIPEPLKQSDIIVPDYKINIVTLKKLSVEKIQSFQSDFQIIAAYVKFQDKPEKLKNFFEKNPHKIRHPLELRKAVAAITKDSRYLKLEFGEKEDQSMCELYDMVLNDGIQQGVKRGFKRGIKQGENRLNSLYQKLKSDGRTDDIMKAIDDRNYQKQLLKEYCL